MVRSPPAPPPVSPAASKGVPAGASLATEVLLSLAYPIALHVLLSLEVGHVAVVLVLAAAALLGVRAIVVAMRSARRLMWLRPAGMGLTLAVLGAIAAFDRQRVLLFYPVVVNVTLGLLFASSLTRERSLIETVARLREPELGKAQVLHCRRATQAWSLFFAANAVVAAALGGFAPLWLWTLHTSVVSYLLAGLLGVVELGIRVRRFGPKSAGPLSRWLVPVLERFWGKASPLGSEP